MTLNALHWKLTKVLDTRFLLEQDTAPIERVQIHVYSIIG